MCKQLLLQFVVLTVNISSWVLVSALNSIGLHQRSSSRFKEFSLGCLVVASPLIWKKNPKNSRNGHLLSFVVTRCATRCHSLSLVVTLCHSLSLVVIRCHSLSLDVPFVCLFINDSKVKTFSLVHKQFYLIFCTLWRQTILMKSLYFQIKRVVGELKEWVI